MKIESCSTIDLFCEVSAMGDLLRVARKGGLRVAGLQREAPPSRACFSSCPAYTSARAAAAAFASIALFASSNESAPVGQLRTQAGSRPNRVRA